jgi:hypothetical protein
MMEVLEQVGNFPKAGGGFLDVIERLPLSFEDA